MQAAEQVAGPAGGQQQPAERERVEAGHQFRWGVAIFEPALTAPEFVPGTALTSQNVIPEALPRRVSGATYLVELPVLQPRV
jgi:hypothetical protein